MEADIIGTMHTDVVAPIGQFDVEPLSSQCFKILFNGAYGGMVASIHSHTYSQRLLKICSCSTGLAQCLPRHTEVVITCSHFGMRIAIHLAPDGQRPLKIPDGPVCLA